MLNAYEKEREIEETRSIDFKIKWASSDSKFSLKYAKELSLIKDLSNLEKKLADDESWQELLAAHAKEGKIEETRSIDFKVNWAREQMACFVLNISGKKQPKGDLSGMPQIRQHCQVVIHYLEELSKTLDSTDVPAEDRRQLTVLLQDVLLKFAIEGGNKCVQAIDRVVRQNLDTILLTENHGTPVAPMVTRLDTGIKLLRMN